MEPQKETFTYTYSAKEQAEIKKIREKYLTREHDKMEELRRLDKSVTYKGDVWSLVVGILGTLLLGVGMCCAMVFNNGTYGLIFIVGIIVGIIGIAVAALAYPLYLHIVKRERERIAPTIIKLTDELLK